MDVIPLNFPVSLPYILPLQTLMMEHMAQHGRSFRARTSSADIYEDHKVDLLQGVIFGIKKNALA